MSDDELLRFCKRARELMMVVYSSVHGELNEGTRKEYLSAQLEQPDNNLVLYVLLRAADRFRTGPSALPLEMRLR